MSSRSRAKETRPLCKEIRRRGFDLVEHGNELLVLDGEGSAVGMVPLVLRDHRTLANVVGELRRNGVLERPRKSHGRPRKQARKQGPERADLPAEPGPPAPATPEIDFYDWMRRPRDPASCEALRRRLEELLDPDSAFAQEPRFLAHVALAIGRLEGRRAFAGDTAATRAFAGERAILHVLRGGQITVWAQRLLWRAAELCEGRDRACIVHELQTLAGRSR